MNQIKCLRSQTPSLSLLLAGMLVVLGGAAQAAGPEPVGWYAGDMHVHRSCGTPPLPLSTIYDAMVSQDLRVVALLADMGNGEVQDQTTDLPLVTGQDEPNSPAGRTLHWDAEWHWDPGSGNPQQALGGHIVALGLSSARQMWSEYTYPIFNWAHQQGGIAGFVHLQYLDEGIPQNLSCCLPLEYPVEVALGTCDFIAEDVAGSSAALSAYYRLLNCGFRPGFAAGSDFPCGASMGPMVTYAQAAGGQFSYRNWLQGIANGRTVVSRNGHNEFIELKVNGSATPGDEVRLSAAGSVSVTVQWTARQSLSGTLELVCNGAVVASKPASVGPETPDTLSATVPFPRSGWLCARRMNGGEHQLHTGAVFVRVNNAPVRASRADAQFYVQWMDNLLQQTSPGGAWSAFFVNDRAAAQARYSSARSLYQQIAQEAAAQEPAPPALGNAAEGTATDPIWQDGSWINAGRFQAISNTAVSALHAKVGAIPGSYKCALYADSGGSPGAFLRGTAQVTHPGEGWAVFALTSPLTVSSGAYYWLAVWSDDANARVYYSGNDGTLISSQNAYGTWPDPLPVTSPGNLNYCIFATGTSPGPSLSSIALSPANATLLTGASQQFTATGRYSDGSTHDLTDQVTWSSSNPAVASVDSGGLAVAMAPGTTTLSATLAGISGSTGLTVPAAGTLNSIALSPSEPALVSGATQQFTATGRYSDGSTHNLTDQVTWSSSDPAVASVSASGLASALAPGTTTVSAALGAVSGSTTLTVRASALAIVTTFLPNGVLNQGYSGTLAAQGGSLPYTWSLADGALPDGLTLDPGSGAIAGLPAVTGTFRFTVQVSDASRPAQTATRPLSLGITQFQTPAFVKGAYTGLFYAPTGTVRESSGCLTLNTTAKGAFSGKLFIQGKSSSFRGTFAPSGQAEVLVRRGKSTLTLHLQLEGTNTVTGTLGDGTWTAPVHADRAVFSSAKRCHYAGLYTFMTPGNENASERPGGDSYGTYKVSPSGRVTLVANLADGTKASQGTAMAEDGSLPLFVSLYRGAGMLIGWLQSSADTAATMESPAVWMKSLPQSGRSRYYPIEFNEPVTIYGLKYTPAGTQPLFAFTNGIVVLSGGNLAAPLTNSIRLLPNNQVEVVAPGPANLRLKLSPGSGKFAGSFSVPPSRKRYSFQGVLLQRNGAAGYFLGTNQSGCVRIGPAGF